MGFLELQFAIKFNFMSHMQWRRDRDKNFDTSPQPFCEDIPFFIYVLAYIFYYVDIQSLQCDDIARENEITCVILSLRLLATAPRNTPCDQNYRFQRRSTFQARELITTSW